MKKRTAALAKTVTSLRKKATDGKQARVARQQIFRELVSIQENERRHISRELHDQMGQHLTALIIGLKTLETSVRDTRGMTQLRDLQKLADDLGSELHRIAFELRPAALDDLGLRAMLTNYLDDWSLRFGVAVDFHAGQAEKERLPSEIETTVYRIVQEGLTNVLKHAKATHVSLILSRNHGELVAVLEDDGKGFDVSAVVRSGSTQHQLGLAGIRERVALAGGTFQIESNPGQGTTLFVRIPLSPPMKPTQNHRDTIP